MVHIHENEGSHSLQRMRHRNITEDKHLQKKCSHTPGNVECHEGGLRKCFLDSKVHAEKQKPTPDSIS